MEVKAPKKKKKKRRIRSPHPGVVLIAPRGAYASWRARYLDPDTNKLAWERIDPTKYPSAEARRDWAVDKSKELAARRAALEGGAVRATGTKLSDAIDRYFTAHPHLGERTTSDVKAATEHLKQWAAQMGITSADDLTRAKLMAFRTWFVKLPKKAVLKNGKRGQRVATEDIRGANTTNGDFRRLHMVLGYLRSAELLPKLNGDDLRDAFKQLRVIHERKDFLKPNEIRKVIEAALDHDATTYKETRAEHKKGGPQKGTTTRYEPATPVVWCALMTGLRPHEWIRLQWPMVDVEAGELHIPGKITKTGQPRTVHLLDVSPSVIEVLKAMGVETSGRVFGYTKDLAASTLDRLREYGAPAKFSWQAARRTCGTYLTCSPSIYGAASAFLSAKRLGHGVAIAERHYVGVIRIPATATTLEQAMQIDDLLPKVIEAVRR